MEASNLGQIIGRLMYAGDATVPDALKRRTCEPGYREKQVLELLAKQPVIGAGDVFDGLGVTRDHAAVILYQLWRKGAIVRTGTRCKYRYSLA